MHWRSEMQAEPMGLAGCWSRSPGLQRVTYGLRCGRGWEDHGKGDEGRSCINFSAINILPGGQPDEKSGFLVKGVEMVSANQVSAPETQVKLPPPIDSVHHYHKEGYPAGSLSAGGVYCRQSELLSKYQDLLEPTILPLPSASQFYVEYICALPSEFF